MDQIPEALQPGKHRVHHSYIWLGGLHAAIIVFFSVGVSVMGSLAPEVMADEGMPFEIMLIVVGLSALGGLLIVAVIFLIQWLSWKNLSYELSATEFNLYSGILSKKRRHLPYQRVQAVNQSAGVFQRILGLCNVQIDTAGGAVNEAVSLKYIRNSDAEALRSELFRRKKIILAGGAIDECGNAFMGEAFATRPSASNVLDAADEILSDVRGVFGGQEVYTGRVSYETGLSNKELLLAGVSGAADYLGILAVAVLGVAGLVMPALEGMLENWMASSLEAALTAESAEGALSLAGAALWSMVFWAVGALVFLWVLSALGTVVKYGGFRARRRENRIEVEHGLLKRTFSGVDIDRVQSIIIDQGLITRLLGYCELSVGKIDSMASSEEGGSSISHSVRLHPFVKISRVPEILEGLAPEFADIPQETVKPAPVALRRAIIRKTTIRSAVFWVFLLALGLQVSLRLGAAELLSVAELSILKSVLFAVDALFIVTALIHAADAVLWHRHSGMGYNRSFMSVTNGGLTVKTTVFPRKKIQFAYTQANPFQRRVFVKTVAAVTAAGIEGTTESLWDIAEDQADEWMEWVRPRGSQGIPQE